MNGKNGLQRLKRSKTPPRSATKFCSRSRRPNASADPAERAAWLTFVIVGAGATGVELGGSAGRDRDIIRLSRISAAFSPQDAKILVVGGQRPRRFHLPRRSVHKAEKSLVKLGVAQAL